MTFTDERFDLKKFILSTFDSVDCMDDVKNLHTLVLKNLFFHKLQFYDSHLI